MEEYIDSIIRVGKILIGSIMVVFVLWYIVKDIVKAYGKDEREERKKKGGGEMPTLHFSSLYHRELFHSFVYHTGPGWLSMTNSNVAPLMICSWVI